MSKESNSNITFLLILTILVIAFFSPQLTKLSGGGMLSITGRVEEQTFVMNVTTGNNVPKICCQRKATMSAQTINLDSWKSISVLFNVSDVDGTTGLKSFGNLTGAGDDDGLTKSVSNYNITCTYTGQSNATSKQFNCSAKIWYFYRPGRWNISINASDGANWIHYENMTEIVLAQTKAMVISPTSLSWTSLNLGADNQTASNDPININNTGNYNVTYGKINVTAYDLHGEVAGYADEDIPAANFTVSGAAGGTSPNFLECQGTAMANVTSTNIAISMLPVGNHSVGFKYGTPGNGKTGFENISFCLIDVPNSNMITAGQAYSTAETADWIIGID